MDDSIPFKKCNRCEVEYPLTRSHWWVDPGKCDGFSTICKICKKEKRGPRQSPDGMKYCHACKTDYPATLEYFHRNIRQHENQTYQLSTYCKVCSSLRGKTRQRPSYDDPFKHCNGCGRDLPATTEHFALARGVIRSQCKQCIKEYDRKKNSAISADSKLRRYQRRNKEHQREYDRLRRLTHGDLLRQRSDAFRKEHLEYYRVLSHRRRALVAGAEGTHTTADIFRLYDLQNGMCKYCNRDISSGYHIDHVIPLSRGGSNWPDNLALACPSCNLSKCDKLLDEWQH